MLSESITGRRAMPTQLQIRRGHFSDKGLKSENQDCLGCRDGGGSLLITKGIAAAIADGVSSSEYGGEAAIACVRGFLGDYFSTPESWSVKKSAQQIFTALNGWLHRQDAGGRGFREGRITTLSAVVFKSTTAHIFHIGDSRIYRLRDGTLEQLTVDHKKWISPDKSYLSRAMGVDMQLQIDYKRHALELNDIYLMTTDGVHEFVSEKDVIDIVLQSQNNLDKAAELLARKALQSGSQDNVSCQLLQVAELPSQDVNEVLNQLTELPFPPDLHEGMILDGYRVVRELHASSRSQLYLVIDGDTGLQLVMKTPSANYVDDPAYIERFTMEEWVGRRIVNQHVAKVYEPTRRRRFLYHISEYIEGVTLRQWMHDNPTPDLERARSIVEQIANGLQAFHRQEMLHQDLKPENIVFDHTGTLKIVDFGSVKVAGIAEIQSPLPSDRLLGTKNYTAPEYLETGAITNSADIFSLGVICYEMLTGELPYGEMQTNWKSEHTVGFKYRPATDFFPALPVWVDGALRKAVSVNPDKRYRELSEFLFDLRTPNTALIVRDYRPLLERSPLRFWQLLSGVLAGALLISLVLLLR